MGYWGFKPTYIGKNTTTKMGDWGFKPIANFKNTSKEPLKCHFVHLGPLGSASRNNGVLVSNSSPIVKIRVRNPSNAILCTLGPRVPPATKMGYWGFKPIANFKNTSKEPLKCPFAHLKFSGPASRNSAVLGF
ncbi:Hypothetical protein FKW44_000481 [Caligus rogercresseyi]|uniref:Uncharacterized protein n=1 Tax=Caligus rogercresseyi TaxID=217165 RepID=A0A7T8QUW7_CALRO|nr:Hypothetical protein FKW44_000481 [Caligus rogercresseyi]